MIRAKCGDRFALSADWAIAKFASTWSSGSARFSLDNDGLFLVLDSLHNDKALQQRDPMQKSIQAKMGDVQGNNRS
jgi:hypothetical protein